MRRWRWVGVLVSCAVVFAACGTDHKSAATTTPPATTATASTATDASTPAPAPAATVAPALEPTATLASELRPTVALDDLDQLGGALGAPAPEDPDADTEEQDSVGQGKAPQRLPEPQPDGALDAGAALRAAPAILQRFKGTRGDENPPDAVGAIGLNEFVLATNDTLLILDREGKRLVSEPLGTLWASAGGRCATNPRGDPALIYDEIGQRFVLTQFAFAGDPGKTKDVETFQCLAISNTPDASGKWSVTDFRWGDRFHDYPKIGVAPGAYAMTSYADLPDGRPVTRMALVERDALLALREPRVQQFDVGPGWLPLIPGDLEDAAPAGVASAVFAGISDDNWSDGTSTADEVVVVQVPVDFDAEPPTPQVVRLAASSFDSTLCKGDLDCAVQPGTTRKLDALGWYTMSRVPVRVRPDGNVSLVVAADVQARAEDRSGVRWFEIRDPYGTPSIAQQGTWAPDDGINRFIASPAMDAAGNLAIAYDVSGGAVKPGVRYDARAPGDPAGTLPIAEGTLIEGEGVETGTSRWGDYATLTVDPGDGCTFWLAGQFAPATSATATDVVTFRLPGCTPGG